MNMHEVAAQLKGMMAALADVEKIAGALHTDNQASRKVKGSGSPVPYTIYT